MKVRKGEVIRASDINRLFDATEQYRAQVPTQKGEFAGGGVTVARDIGRDKYAWYPCVSAHDFAAWSVMTIKAGETRGDGPKFTVEHAVDGGMLVTNGQFPLFSGETKPGWIHFIDFHRPSKVRVDPADADAEYDAEVGPADDGTVSTDGSGLKLVTDPDDNDFAYVRLIPSAAGAKLVKPTAVINPLKVGTATVYAVDDDGTDVDLDAGSTITVLNVRQNYLESTRFYMAHKIGDKWCIDNQISFDDEP